ncbi:hypothetical protein, partial [Burkholderia ubonensis]|uniref:hypothetical protein n=1 Tax=Burkholderia ubonensis TaxID=101571 RepID=UPI001E5AAD0F
FSCISLPSLGADCAWQAGLQPASTVSQLISTAALIRRIRPERQSQFGIPVGRCHIAANKDKGIVLPRMGRVVVVTTVRPPSIDINPSTSVM